MSDPARASAAGKPAEDSSNLVSWVEMLSDKSIASGTHPSGGSALADQEIDTPGSKGSNRPKTSRYGGSILQLPLWSSIKDTPRSASPPSRNTALLVAGSGRAAADEAAPQARRRGKSPDSSGTTSTNRAASPPPQQEKGSGGKAPQMQVFEGVAVSAATSTAASPAESSVAFASASASVSTPAGAAESSSPSGLSGRLHAIRSIKRGITLAAQSSFLSASASASASAATEASGGGSGGGTGAGIRVSRSGEGLRSFPLELVTEELVARLCVLDLSRNVLSALPTVIGCFTQLQQLELQHNALRVLSPQLGSLQMLTCLRLSHNVLTELPGELGQLARLRVLDLAENQLGGVPLPARAFKGLTSLELLDLSANQLAFDSFPRDLPWEHLASLQRLKLRANRLGALPPLHRLPALRRLQLKGNPLQALPFSLEQLRSSRDVARHVLEYCRSLYEGGEADWRFLRVLFIGREGAGRSSLIRLLRAATSSSSSSSLSIPSSLSSSSSSSFSANFTSASSSGSGVGTGDGVGEVEGGAPHLPQLAAWPALLQTPVLAEWGGGGGAGSEEGPIVFALQEVPAGSAEAAAPLLFTERAVYVFVFRATESAASLLPWLEAQLRLVRATIGDSVHPPLLLVATHLDQASPEHLAALWAEMQERVFPRVPFRRSSLSPENCLAVSCRNKKGLKELQARLRDVALRGEGLLRRRVPTSWKALLAAVRSTRAQLPHTHSAAAGAPAPPAGMLHWSEWETLARSCNVDASSLAPATQLLHDAGELWHAESPRELADLVFLEPRAVLEVFAHVPRSAYVKGGLLHHRFLPQMFARYPAPLHAPLLRLLERAQLVLPWKCAADGTQHSLVPLLLTEKPDANLDFVLPSNGPSYTWFLERRYEFPYAAVGFFPRLIVRVLASLKEVSAYHIWRNALALVVNSTDQQGYVHYCNSASGAMLIIRVVSLSYTLREKFFSQLVACVEALLVSFYSSLLQNTRRFAVCSHCLAILRRSPTSTPASAPAPAAPPLQPTVFELTELSARLMSGRKVVTCRSERGGQVERPIRVDEIAPDLSLSRLAWLEPSALQLLEELGKGGFGVVFKAQLGARLVAVKKLRSVASLDNAADAQEAFSAMQEFQLEATLMQSLHHRNLVRFFGVTPPPDIAMVMEYVPFGDLGRLLEAREPALDMQRFRLRVALDIARGMRYLHSMHVIHRDLKTSNVFICALDPDAPVVAKVADFGLSQVCVDDASAGLLENWLYTAPETWERKTYTTKADVWSFWVVLYELAMRQSPWAEALKQERMDWRIRQMILEGMRPRLPPAEDPLTPLIEACWCLQEADRPSFQELVARLAPLVGQEEQDPPPEPGEETGEERPALELRLRGVLGEAAAPAASSTPNSSEPRRTVYAIVFVQNCLWAATSGGTIEVWNLETNKRTRELRADRKGGRVYGLAVVPPGLVWSGGEDALVHVWGTLSLQELETLSRHTQAVKAVLCCVQQELVLSADVGGELLVWSSRSRQCLQSLALGAPISCLATVADRLFAGVERDILEFELLPPAPPAAASVATIPDTSTSPSEALSGEAGALVAPTPVSESQLSGDRGGGQQQQQPPPVTTAPPDQPQGPSVAKQLVKQLALRPAQPPNLPSSDLPAATSSPATAASTTTTSSGSRSSSGSWCAGGTASSGSSSAGSSIQRATPRAEGPQSARVTPRAEGPGRARGSSAPGSSGRRLLHDLVRAGRVDELRKVLSEAKGRAALHEVDTSGQTALHLAASLGQADALEALLQAGANVNARDRVGWSPLFAAAAAGHLSIVDRLLDHGADLSPANDRCTPLHYLARARPSSRLQLEAWRSLVERMVRGGNALTATNHSLETPLHMCALKGTPQTVQALVAMGAPLHMRTSAGASVLQYALQTGRSDIVEVLLEVGRVPPEDAAACAEFAASMRGIDPSLVERLRFAAGATPAPASEPESAVTPAVPVPSAVSASASPVPRAQSAFAPSPRCRQVRLWRAHKRIITDLLCLEDEVWSCSVDGRVCVWPARVSDDGTEQSSSAARPLYEMDLRDKLHSMTAFARGGVTYVVSAKWLDVTLSVWNAERRELEQLLDTRHTDGIRCLAASPELRLLVSGASDGLICLWEIS